MKWLTPDERDQLLSWLDSGDVPNGKYGYYYRLFIAIALESGLRITEILGGESTIHGEIKGLTHGQADPDNERWDEVLRLKRKDAPRIRAYMGPRTRRVYLNRFPVPQNPDSRIFSEGPHRNDVLKFCKRLGKRLGIDNLTPHRLRHTAGKDIMRYTKDLSKVQAALGHKHMGTAMIYSEASEEEGFEAMKKIRGNMHD